MFFSRPDGVVFEHAVGPHVFLVPMMNHRKKYVGKVARLRLPLHGPPDIRSETIDVLDLTSRSPELVGFISGFNGEAARCAWWGSKPVTTAKLMTLLLSLLLQWASTSSWCRFGTQTPASEDTATSCASTSTRHSRPEPLAAPKASRSSTWRTRRETRSPARQTQISPVSLEDSHVSHGSLVCLHPAQPNSDVADTRGNVRSQLASTPCLCRTSTDWRARRLLGCT